MIELAQHIEALLLENDCVIVPDLGGFVAHYAPAAWVKEENIFLPPTRNIGFNPQLKMNDGLLVQSYMAVYGTDFSDATRMVERKVDELISILHEEGRVELPNVGEVRYTISNTLDFVPYDNKIATPYLYGLDAFEMQELSALKRPETVKAIPHPAAGTGKGKRAFTIRLNRSYLTNAAAVVAAVVLSFFFSVPIENTEVAEENYAQLLPDELFGKIEKQSLAVTPIVKKQHTPAQKSATAGQAGTRKKTVVPVAVKEVKVSPAPKPQAQPATARPAVKAPKKLYHIIVASVGTEQDAEKMAARLASQGFQGAKAIVGDGKMRVSIESCGTETEAYQALARIRQHEAYKSAWVLKK